MQVLADVDTLDTLDACWGDGGGEGFRGRLLGQILHRLVGLPLARWLALPAYHPGRKYEESLVFMLMPQRSLCLCTY